MRLLLISNSTMAGEPYLDYPKQNIKDFLGSEIKKTLFIPFAGVTFSFDDYAQKAIKLIKQKILSVLELYYKF